MTKDLGYEGVFEDGNFDGRNIRFSEDAILYNIWNEELRESRIRIEANERRRIAEANERRRIAVKRKRSDDDEEKKRKKAKKDAEAAERLLIAEAEAAERLRIAEAEAAELLRIAEAERRRIYNLPENVALRDEAARLLAEDPNSHTEGKPSKYIFESRSYI